MSSLAHVRPQEVVRARLARHKRVFAEGRSAYLIGWLSWAKETLGAIGSTLRSRVKTAPRLIPWEAPRTIHLPSRLLRRFAAIAFTIILTSTFLPAAYSEAYEDTSEDLIIVDSEGYLSKASPLTYLDDRSDMTDKATHSVAPGETLSLIAQHYGVKVETILWENNMVDPDRLRVGTELVVPPIDGINHTVRKGENLEKIAKTYNIDKALVIKQNKLQTETITEGQTLFVPGGRRLVADISRESFSRTGTIGSTRYVDVPRPQPSQPGRLLWPTRGKLTQGFRRGHYAIDIADPSKPPVWSAAAGKVTKTNVGNWGHGYGNHVMIDHGNGLQTLYAHLETVNVKEGDIVDQGQVIGKMGRTGRVYGKTGIHVHFEVIKNGVKQVPSKFF